MPIKHSDQQIAFGWLEPNTAEIAARAKRLVDSIRDRPDLRTHFLISCGKHKEATQAPAGKLYTSTRFQLSTALAIRLNQPFSVLSAKHGLLSPNTVIEPYDFELKSMTHDDRIAWAKSIVENLHIGRGAIERIVLLADEEYVVDLLPVLARTDVEIVDPLKSFYKAGRLSLLKSCNRFLDRGDAAQALYRQFESHAEKSNLLMLREALQNPIPSQGVYFFFDPEEHSRFSTRIPRLVRVGTHGVSAGSKATLRDRLRAHLGTSDGYGNHRSSVFRLHIGEALIRKDDLRAQFPHWGKGQNANKSVRDDERPLEQEVSDYISRLGVICVEVSDKAAKHSARSTIERLSIALFTEDFLPVEESSSDWLGNFSQHEVIAKTGLWNIRDVGTKADPRIIDLIQDRISVAGTAIRSDQ